MGPFCVSPCVHEYVRVKEAKIKTLTDEVGHRGSERQTEREMRLFMGVHDQCDQGTLGVFPSRPPINQSNLGAQLSSKL